jgi:hypothetical protein
MQLGSYIYTPIGRIKFQSFASDWLVFRVYTDAQRCHEAAVPLS